MSVNTAHANNGVLIHAGEYILLYSDNVTIEYFGQDDLLFKGTKHGKIYLTTHRMIFNNKNRADPMQSFSFPFILLRDVELEQPVFGANYIKGIVRAQPNGNWTGETKFKLIFKSGGAVEFGQAMLRAARMAQSNLRSDSPPPYTPPTGDWYEAPPPAYQPPPGYYGWLPQTDAFSSGPPPNSVYMSGNLPPYPGISGQNPPPPQPGYPGAPPSYQAGYPGGFQLPPQSGGYPSCPAPGFPGGYSSGGPGYPGGYPSAAQGYPGAPGCPGAPGYPGGHPPGASGFQPGGYPGTNGPPPNQQYPLGPNYSHPSQPPQNGYPGGAATNIGFTSGPSQNSKEAEAAQSAYYDPNAPQTAYVPPPAYYEPPPSYNSVSDKKTQ